MIPKKLEKKIELAKKEFSENIGWNKVIEHQFLNDNSLSNLVNVTKEVCFEAGAKWLYYQLKKSKRNIKRNENLDNKKR